MYIVRHVLWQLEIAKREIHMVFVWTKLYEESTTEIVAGAWSGFASYDPRWEAVCGMGDRALMGMSRLR